MVQPPGPVGGPCGRRVGPAAAAGEGPCRQQGAGVVRRQLAGLGRVLSGAQRVLTAACGRTARPFSAAAWSLARSRGRLDTLVETSVPGVE